MEHIDMSYETFKIQVKHRRCENLPNGRFTTYSLPDTTEQVSVYVDFAAIAKRLGPRAAKSKSGKARYLHGAVIVKHDGAA